jgi:thymidine phosphorylase
MSGIARTAGAPMDKSAGIDLHIQEGDTLTVGDPLYFIHANVETDFRIAVERSENDTGIKIN